LRFLGWKYDIREIDEDLYLAVLACRLGEKGASDRVLSDAACLSEGQEGTERDL
jgi:hypothetical protein